MRMNQAERHRHVQNSRIGQGQVQGFSENRLHGFVGTAYVSDNCEGHKGETVNI